MVKATIVLADAATVSEGKLNLLGAGWNLIGPQPAPTAIGLLLEIPWDEANRRHHLRLSLTNADGHPIQVRGPDGTEQALEILAVGRVQPSQCRWQFLSRPCHSRPSSDTCGNSLSMARRGMSGAWRLTRAPAIRASRVDWR